MARNAFTLSVPRVLTGGLCALYLSVLTASSDAAGGRGISQNLAYGPGGEIEISFFCPFDEVPAKGFLPLTVAVENNTNAPVEIRIAGQSETSAWPRKARFDSNFAMQAEKKSTRTSSLLVPLPTQISSSGYSSMNITLDCFVTGFRKQTARFNLSGDTPEILLCPKSDWDTANASLSGSAIGATRFNPANAPADWRAYSAFEVIVLRASNWTALSPPAQRAIFDWVRLGGRLILWDGVAPSSALDRIFDALPDDEGLGEIFRVDAKSDLKQVEKNAWLHNPNTSANLESSFQSRDWSLLASMGERKFGTTLVIVVLIAFGILVGPVNLFYLAKAGRRHLLFFTTPAISLATSLLLAAVILFQDGFGGSGKRLVVIQSDPAQNKLFLSQEQVARTGVVLDRAFETSDPAWITHASLDTSRWTFVNDSNKNDVRFNLNGRKYSGDWFRSRSEQAHFGKSVVQSKMRIELVNGGRTDAPTLLSSFACTLSPVYYVDESGDLWFTDELKSGKPSTLSKPAGDFDMPWAAHASLASNLLASPVKRVAKQSVRNPGDFFALAEGNDVPVIDAGPMRWETSALIFGQVRQQGALKTNSAP